MGSYDTVMWEDLFWVLPGWAALIIMKWQEVVGYGSICCCGLVRLSEDCLQVREEMPWIRCALQPRPRAAWIQSSKQTAAAQSVRRSCVKTGFTLASRHCTITSEDLEQIQMRFEISKWIFNNSFYFSVEIESLMTLTFWFFQSVAKWHAQDCGISGDMSYFKTNNFSYKNLIYNITWYVMEFGTVWMNKLKEELYNYSSSFVCPKRKWTVTFSLNLKDSLHCYCCMPSFDYYLFLNKLYWIIHPEK